MKSNFKTVAAIFLAALAFYLIAYYAIEYRRTRLGPWQVSFVRTDSNQPALRIDQNSLAITNVQIVFSNAVFSADTQTAAIAFARPKPVPFEIPWGECIFMDTTFQPGTVVLKISGHEIQLLPRVLTIDQQEHPWHSNEQIILSPVITNQTPALIDPSGGI
jgi:hypothetical protein